MFGGSTTCFQHGSFVHTVAHRCGPKSEDTVARKSLRAAMKLGAKPSMGAGAWEAGLCKHKTRVGGCEQIVMSSPTDQLPATGILLAAPAVLGALLADDVCLAI